MRRFVNEVLYMTLEWGVVALALSLAAGMTILSCTSDVSHTQTQPHGMHLN